MHALIHGIDQRSRCSYGSSRIREELADEHRRCMGRKRVAPLMSEQG
jgi:hypothetical protein